MSQNISKANVMARNVIYISIAVFFAGILTEGLFLDLYLPESLYKYIYFFKIDNGLQENAYLSMALFLTIMLVFMDTVTTKKIINSKVSLPLSFCFLFLCLTSYHIFKTPYANSVSNIEKVSPNHHAVKAFYDGISSRDIISIKSALVHKESVSLDIQLSIIDAMNRVSCVPYGCETLKKLQEHEYLSQHDYYKYAFDPNRKIDNPFKI